MRILVTGGAGFIGSHLVDRLMENEKNEGSFENLEKIRNAGVKCPLLCKKFVVDAWQIYYARTKGTDAILLIAVVLPDLDIRYIIKICKLLGLMALVELTNSKKIEGDGSRD